ncbi:MAG: outer membrane protein assembly factor BamD [Candidatus Omnitrophica bacterium]|jgi:outer membrane assembly lipoprotein YfiO|nr:outer membrane protein assembly factor BamD [Candidatus Omnitrophota bacterium]
MRRSFFVILAALAMAVAMPAAHAYWIWTPQTGTWINPKWAVKDTPQEQFDWAMKFFESKEYKKAAEEFQKLVRYYPQAELAAEAEYYAGKSYECIDEYEQAFNAYQKAIETYPFSKRLDEMMELQYEIGNKFYLGEKVRLWGIPTFPSVFKAIEMYQKVIDNAPYGKFADQALYKMGECYKKAGDFQQARLTFQKLVDEHPESKLAEEANFQVGLCASQASLKPSYDQSETDSALQEIEDFSKRHPESALTGEADKMRESLREKKAQSDYDIAEFYWRLKQYESAAVYYKSIVNTLPDTDISKKAQERLDILEKKKKK